MDPASPPAPGPRLPRPRVRWGLGDAALCWLGGILGAVLLSAVAVATSGSTADDVTDDPAVLAGSLLGQLAGMLVVLVLASRVKGRGTLGRDFGLEVRARDGWWVPVGLALQVAIGVALVPLARLDGREQEVVRQLQDAAGVELALLALSALVLAPVVEELLFRGLLLRALLRRTGPVAAVAWSALVFGAVHLVDPDALTVLPGLVAIGVVSGVLAVRSGSLSRSILLHVGFNALVTLGAVFG